MSATVLEALRLPVRLHGRFPGRLGAGGIAKGQLPRSRHVRSAGAQGAASRVWRQRAAASLVRGRRRGGELSGIATGGFRSPGGAGGLIPGLRSLTVRGAAYFRPCFRPVWALLTRAGGACNAPPAPFNPCSGGIEREQSIRQAASGRAATGPRHGPKSSGKRRSWARSARWPSAALAGRAYWLSGQSGTGKTTIARLLAAEVADDFSTQEVDASALTVAALRELERESQISGWGEKGGRAYLVNEAHGLRKDVIRQFLVMLERVPSHVVWIFTTTTEGEQGLFEDYDDAGPLLSRCLPLPLAGATWRKPSPSAARKSRSARDSTAGPWNSTSG